MKSINFIGAILLTFSWAYADDMDTQGLGQTLEQISQYRMLSDNLASSSTVELHEFQYLKEAGYQHVVNLSTGLHLVEKTHVEALGMTYVQIKVPLTEPSDLFYDEFKQVMDSYGDEPVYIYSEKNWRASTFAYWYQNMHDEARLLAAE